MSGFLAGLVAGAAAGAAGTAWFLRRRSKDLGAFVSFAAHEVSTPITAINMTVINLLSDVFGPLTAEQKPWVEMTREQIQRLNGIIGELRDLVHLQLGKEIVIRIESVPLADAVDSALNCVKEGCRQAGIEVLASVDPAARPVSADPDRIARTLASMLYHGRKFRASGPLKLSVRPQGAFTAFELEFQGPAVSADEARRSLELFYPARAPKGSMTATGAGLGVPRMILQRQGGDLALSVDGRRHLLTMTLPAAK
jgi:signal transduction histidine kinase